LWSTPYALHASSSSSTVFLKGKDVVAYLRSPETTETKLNVLDFSELASSSPPVPAPVSGGGAASTKEKEKEDAKMEGAVQIAVGVKKEVDFDSWYTNVRFC
jgi:prolyl-tRNA synthetase